MRLQHQSCFFILLMAVSIMPLYASNMPSLRQQKDHDLSLEKCAKRLEMLHTNFGLSSSYSRKMSRSYDCSESLEQLLSNIPSLFQHRSDVLFGSGSLDSHRYSRKDIISAINGDRRNEHFSKKAVYQSLSGELPLKMSTPKISKNNYQKLDAIRNALSDILTKGDGIFRGQNDVQIDKPASAFIHRVAVLKSALTPEGSFRSQRNYFENQPKITYTINSPKDTFNDDSAHEDGSISTTWSDSTPPPKRAPDNWLNVVSTEVAKRRRQTLSINNALMALTDMVMEHGREKLMRNRDNLRYHMYIQG